MQDQDLVLYFYSSQFLILFSNLKINLHNFLLQWFSRINYTSERDRSSFDKNGMKEDNGRPCKFLISSYDISTSSSPCGTLGWPKSTLFHLLSPWPPPSANLHIWGHSCSVKRFAFVASQVHQEPLVSSLRGNNIFRNLIFLAVPSITASEILPLICIWRNNKDYLRCFLLKLI